MSGPPQTCSQLHVLNPSKGSQTMGCSAAPAACQRLPHTALQLSALCIMHACDDCSWCIAWPNTQRLRPRIDYQMRRCFHHSHVHLHKVVAVHGQGVAMTPLKGP